MMYSEFARTARFFAHHPIARSNPMATWYRWIVWQIRSRVLVGPFVIHWISGTKLVVEKGMTGATGNVYCGLHEFADMALLIHFLKGYSVDSVDEPPLFIDVGANVGSYTILAAGVCNANVICIEPAPNTFKKLCRNIDANHLEKFVSAKQSAVGAALGTIQFSIDSDTTNSVVDNDYRGRSEMVPIETIDKLVGDLCPVMLKIDVEGYEEEVLKGAMTTLSKSTVQIVLLESNTDSIQETMGSLGFRKAHYDPIEREIRPEMNGTGNNLWLRDPGVVQSVCRCAPRLMVYGFSI